jgi:hypothetical protein
MPLSGIIELNEQQLKEEQQKEKKIFDSSRSSSSSGLSSEDETEDYLSLDNLSFKNHKMASTEQRYASLPVREKHENFYRQLMNLVFEKAIFEGTKRENKVNEWTSPEELKKIMNFGLKDEPDSDEQLLKLANDTIKYSVKTGHPYFVNQLFSTVDPYGFAGQVITDALNPRYFKNQRMILRVYQPFKKLL